MKIKQIEAEILSMLKLRGYAIYSFEYLEIKMVFKIVNAITTE